MQNGTESGSLFVETWRNVGENGEIYDLPDLHVSWQIMKATITYQVVVIIERNFADRMFLRKDISVHKKSLQNTYQCIKNFVVKVTV